MRAWVTVTLGAVLVASGCSGRSGGSNDAPAGTGAVTSTAGAAGADTAGLAGSASSVGGMQSTGGTIAVTSAGAPAMAEPTPHAAFPCANPTPLPGGGGYTLCADGSLRRASAGTCESQLPRPTSDETPVEDECRKDEDCTAAAHGYCGLGLCHYGCVTDDECGDGQACLCGDIIGTCVPAACRDDADCPADFPCTSDLSGPDAEGGLSCQSPLDECLVKTDCGSTKYDWCLTGGDRRVCAHIVTPG